MKFKQDLLYRKNYYGNEKNLVLFSLEKDLTETMLSDILILERIHPSLKGIEKRRMEAYTKIKGRYRVAEKPAFAKRLHDGQKLAPVLSAGVFYGRKWTGPRRLHDMLEFPPEEAQILRKLVPDYPLNLVEVRKLPPEVRQRFT